MLYEYRCSKCRHIFTLKFPLTQNPKFVSCSECGCLLAERYFGTVPPICFMGPGWASKTELDALDPANDNPQDFSDITGV